MIRKSVSFFLHKMMKVFGDANHGRLGIGDPSPLRDEIRKEKVKQWKLTKHLEELRKERKKWYIYFL